MENLDNSGSLDFAKIVREQTNRVYNVVYFIVGDAEDAEDVTQEVFMRAYKALSGFEERADISTWLYRIAVNAARDHLRKNRREAVVKGRIGGELLEEPARTLKITDNPEAILMGREQNVEIRDALMRLPFKLRSVFVMKELEDYSYRDIGKMLGIPVRTVESRLLRARRLLRENLKGSRGKAGAEYEKV